MKVMRLISLLVIGLVLVEAGTFNVSGNSFELDGNPFTIMSGSIHYFRTHPDQWHDRLNKAVAMGLNTIQTYIPWNLHEPQEGIFDFEGLADVVSFINLANEVGLKVILRPGPYVCAEWEFGGLPEWLLADSPSSGLRCSAGAFMDAVTKWWAVLLPKLKPLLCENGGPVLMVQVENEYGSYGNDKQYLEQLRQQLRTALGENILLYSTDPAQVDVLMASRVDGVFQTCDFGPQPDWNSPAVEFAMLRQVQKTGPLMNSEYYTGWITHWGDATMAERSVGSVVTGLKDILAQNASFNLYMFHGGSNFAFYNGANAGPNNDQADDQLVTVQSYDYDAPLTESGDTTPKYLAIRNVLQQFYSSPLPDIPANSTKAAYGDFVMDQQASLWNTMLFLTSTFPISNPSPLSFEALNQPYGYVVYRTRGISSPNGTMTFQLLHDYAQVYVDHELQGVAMRNPQHGTVPEITFPHNGGTLEILVENHGRINFGPYLKDFKGITQDVRIGQQFLYSWAHFQLPLNNISSIAWGKKIAPPLETITGPTFFRTNVTISGAPADTFVTLPGWTKGHLWVNTFHIGRYWNIGPQYSLYVPAPILQEGSNSIVIFELLSQPSNLTITLSDAPLFT